MTVNQRGDRPPSRSGRTHRGATPVAARWIAALAALAVAGLFLLACGDREPAGDADRLVLAQVGPYQITRRDFDRRLGQLEDSIRKNFVTPEQQAQFLETLVEEKLILLAAESKDLERKPEVQELLADRRAQILVRQYLDQVLVPQAMPDSVDVARYYAENPAEFKVAERVGGRQIVVSTAASGQAIRRRLLAGESFESLLPQSIDPQTRNLGGALGYVQRGAPVRGLGQNPAFIESVLALPAGAVSRPLRTSLGYHVVKVETHEPERVRDVAAVRPALERKLGPKKFEAAFRHTIDSLRGEYQVTVNEQGILGAEGVAERQSRLLFDQAQQAADPVARLKLYQQIVSEYGDSKYGAQAQFMIGFMYADELKDRAKARAAFEQMIARYGKAPYVDSTLVDSARWMLKNMDLPSPALDGDPQAPAAQHGVTPLGTPGTPKAPGSETGGASDRD
jgi:parvulin-like peptidyl-prolyl isomerase